AAELLRHAEIYMDESDLPDLDEDEIYHKDLQHMDIMDEQGTKIGQVKSIQNFGAGDLIEVKPISGKSFYIPFNENYVLDIDTESKQMKVTNYQDFMD
ncbi:MAG: ribosome maturation factor RimM, partial [Pseudomonadota bacterium]|nr:ribosome maturation factor RimM [Pseudomonadota bacterium]